MGFGVASYKEIKNLQSQVQNIQTGQTNIQSQVQNIQTGQTNIQSGIIMPLSYQISGIGYPLQNMSLSVTESQSTQSSATVTTYTIKGSLTINPTNEILMNGAWNKMNYLYATLSRKNSDYIPTQSANATAWIGTIKLISYIQGYQSTSTSNVELVVNSSSSNYYTTISLTSGAQSSYSISTPMTYKSGYSDDSLMMLPFRNKPSNSLLFNKGIVLSYEATVVVSLYNGGSVIKNNYTISKFQGNGFSLGKLSY